MKEFENVDIFDSIDAESGTLGFLDKKSAALDGIYRPKITDKTKGYSATIRFLPNISKEKKVLQYAIEKHQHYVDFKSHPDLSGYYDCGKNLTDKCDICTMFWKLKQSNNASDVEKSDLIKRNTKYYSYVLIEEDEQNPDLEGKILVFSYGYKIKEKIKDQKEGISGEPCNVFDLANGKSFRLVIKEIAGFPNYDSSTFQDTTPIKINGKKAPVEIGENGKNKITNTKVKEAIMKFLLDRTVEVEEHQAKEWGDEDKIKISQILDILNGNDVSIVKAAAESKFDNAKTTDEVANDAFGEDDDGSDFFDIDG